MAKYNPFAEKAGMRKIAEQKPQKPILQIAETLQKLGFNLQLLGSTKHVLTMLKKLDSKQVNMIKEAFVKSRHIRFMKYFFSHMPYGKHEKFKQKIMKANLEKLAHLIKVCNFLMQTKVYLFWSMSNSRGKVKRQS